MNAVLVCMSLCCASPVELSSTVSIQADDDPTRVVVRYRIPPAKSAEWAEAIAGADRQDSAPPRCFISLHLCSGDQPRDTDFQQPGIIGVRTIKDGFVEFRPRFALGRGQWYRAFVSEASDLDRPYLVARATYEVPAEGRRDPTSVIDLSPPIDPLPANLLKFRIQFNRPMREGRETFERIHLLDEAGKEIPHPWRDLELWTHEGLVLSLYIHPGRIKQGVNLREEFGPVLKPRGRYTLLIDASMRDANGFPLKGVYRHEFVTGPEIRKKIDVAAWKFDSSIEPVGMPEAGSRGELIVEFDRLLDTRALDEVFWVRGPRNEKLVGHFDRDHGLRRIGFTPEEPWRAGKHQLVVNRELQDLAGNTPNTVFDRDLDVPTHDPTEAPIERTFEIR